MLLIQLGAHTRPCHRYKVPSPLCLAGQFSLAPSANCFFFFPPPFLPFPLQTTDPEFLRVAPVPLNQHLHTLFFFPRQV